MTERSEREHLAHVLFPIHRKLDLIIELIGADMADVSKLNEAIDVLGTDEEAAVTELKDLSEELAGLDTTVAPSQEQIDALTSKAAAIATALSGATSAAAAEDVPPAPPVEAPPVETPAPAPEAPAPEATPAPETPGA